MPIPQPKSGEAEKDYISRCVSFIFKEGTLNGKKLNKDNEDDRKQAVAVCYSTLKKANEEELVNKINFITGEAVVQADIAPDTISKTVKCKKKKKKKKK